MNFDKHLHLNYPSQSVSSFAQSCPTLSFRISWTQAGKDLRWEEKGTTEDEMVGWHHRLNGHEFE